MSVRSWLRASAGVPAAVLLAMLALASVPVPAAAVEPPLLDEDRMALEGHEPPGSALPPAPPVLRPPRRADDAAEPTPTPSATPSPTPEATPEPQTPGYDISYPQCGGPFPEPFSFAIVGVNGGRVFSANPCLGTGDGPSQLEWAGREAELYLNTGNPGPRLSSFWPIGQDDPAACVGEDTDSAECAYVYGWNAARYAHDVALDAFVDLEWADADAEALPGEVTWWLDVEHANSWRADAALNVATLQGMVDALETLGAAEVGFYSTPRMWDRITGATRAFEEHPAWHAGARDRADAEARCGRDAFTGGELRMVQWVEDGFDANVRCAGGEGD